MRIPVASFMASWLSGKDRGVIAAQRSRRIEEFNAPGALSISNWRMKTLRLGAGRI